MSLVKCRLALWFLHFLCSVSYTFGSTGLTRTVALTKLQRQSSLDGYTCLSQDHTLSVDVSDLYRCLYTCMQNTSCETVFFNKARGKCEGCDVLYTPTSLPSPAAGFIHFQKEQTASSVGLNIISIPSQTCDSGWTSFMGSCYKLTTATTFPGGAFLCDLDGAHPVYIETSEENDFLKTFVQQNGGNEFAWYIGLTDSETNGDYKYYGTNTTPQFLDFHHSSPDDTVLNTQQCVVIASSTIGFNYQWSDHTCYDIYRIICEK